MVWRDGAQKGSVDHPHSSYRSPVGGLGVGRQCIWLDSQVQSGLGMLLLQQTPRPHRLHWDSPIHCPSGRLKRYGVFSHLTQTVSIGLEGALLGAFFFGAALEGAFLALTRRTFLLRFVVAIWGDSNLRVSELHVRHVELR